MKKVFISYSYQDSMAKQFARFLNEHLPTLGAEAVAVSDAFEAGDNWQMGITEEINKCSVFICFVERDNSNVMFELGYALAKNKKIILVGDFVDLPVDLRSMIYVPREAHPYDILMHVEKQLTREAIGVSPYDVDVRDPQQAIRVLLDRPELLDSLAPREFEELVMRWFTARGLQVEPSSVSRDYGYDLLVYPFRGERAVVEVKKYKSTSQVPLATIRQLVGSMAIERIPCGIIVSTAPFSRSADFFVQDIQPTVLLWTLEDLARMDEDPKISVDNYVSPHTDTG
jgi:HJR/Mrr/RecB family endonuclease